MTAMGMGFLLEMMKTRAKMTVVVVTLYIGYTKNLCIVNFKWVNWMVCEFFLNDMVINKIVH